ncbi:hypothetical protein C2845_PM06G28080 [Panicum miliaceum]|uniref:Reverse transcriptase zinc-binding domain-containing protein n=1 Tax=Panicum miliaceum TaxID=4540 RepID=A0A3L6RDX8_PANMI|nr:hypothetical protein C2845_PM06G28080 [Panicum miliaceum]
MALEVTEILKIKPSTMLAEDVRAWAFEKNGLYSVRSAYRLLKDEQAAMAMAKSDEARGSGDDRAWNLIWKLKVPLKVHLFWWRALQNFLPSKLELKWGHIIPESYCELCGDPEEMVFHVIFCCPVAKRFWAEVFPGISIPMLHPSTWAMDVLDTNICSVNTASLVVCEAWTLWSARNARRHGRKTWEPGATVR